MGTTSRDRWNRKYADGVVGLPSPLVLGTSRLLPTSGRALDVAGGAGRHALWLARRGLDVTLVDVSDAAVALAGTGDPRPGSMVVQRRDLEVDGIPAGPWDVILVFHYLQRSLFPALAAGVGSGGVLVYAQPTLRNLERHTRPGADFLVREGELRTAFAGDLEVIRYDEGWRHDDGGAEQGRHEALLVARRRPGRPIHHLFLDQK